MVTPLDCYYDANKNEVWIRIFHHYDGIYDLKVVIPSIDDTTRREPQTLILEPEIIPVFSFQNQLLYSIVYPKANQDTGSLATIFIAEI